MQTIHTDIAIIGAGTAGLAAYRAAKAAGKAAILIEAGRDGTTCARVGCMPSKLLIAAAEAAHAAQAAAEFGVRIDNMQVDGRAVMARVRSERDRFVGFVLAGQANIPAEDRLRGHARFIDNRLLQVDEHTQLHAHSIVIATGSRPHIPAPFYALGDRVVVNDDLFEWPDLPRRVAVFGPGVIGLELGQALHRLGVEVKIFGRGGGLGPFTDPAIRDYATQVLQAELDLDTDADIAFMRREGDEVVLGLSGENGRVNEARFDYVLLATGRVPNVDQLGLANSGLQLDERGVPRFDRFTLQCGHAPVFIAGDANHVLPLLHEAADEGKIAGRNAALYPHHQAGARSAPLAVVFSDPQLAMVGMRFNELVAGSFVIGEVSFENQGRARVMAKNKGLLHVYAERSSGRFLGAEWLGPAAEHIAHLLAWSYQAGFSIDQMLAMPFYHPVIEEGLRTALRDAQAKLLAHAEGKV